MDPRELDRLEALWRQTSPGRWELALHSVPHPGDNVKNQVGVKATPVHPGHRKPKYLVNPIARSPRCSFDDEWERNAPFIAEAHQAVPELIAEVRRLQAELSFWLGTEKTNRQAMDTSQLRDSWRD